MNPTLESMLTPKLNEDFRQYDDLLTQHYISATDATEEAVESKRYKIIYGHKIDTERTFKALWLTYQINIFRKEGKL